MNHRCETLKREDLSPCYFCGKLPFFGCYKMTTCCLYIGCIGCEKYVTELILDKYFVNDAIVAWNRLNKTDNDDSEFARAEFWGDNFLDKILDKYPVDVENIEIYNKKRLVIMAQGSLNSGVYQILNTVNGKRYIGSTNNFNKRKNCHWSQLNNKIHSNSHLQNAWNKYSATAFVFKIMLVCADINCLFFEQKCIDKFRPEYNISQVAGSSLGIKRSAESIEKVASKIRGIKHTLEHNAKISIGGLGKKRPPFSDEHREKLSKAHIGKVIHSDEWKAAQRELMLGNTRGLGYKFTEEQLNNLIEAKYRTSIECSKKLNYGVSKVGNRYRSHIHQNGKSKHLGYFDTMEEAHERAILEKFGSTVQEMVGDNDTG